MRCTRPTKIQLEDVYASHGRTSPGYSSSGSYSSPVLGVQETTCIIIELECWSRVRIRRALQGARSEPFGLVATPEHHGPLMAGQTLPGFGLSQATRRRRLGARDRRFVIAGSARRVFDRLEFHSANSANNAVELFGSFAETAPNTRPAGKCDVTCNQQHWSRCPVLSLFRSIVDHTIRLQHASKQRVKENSVIGNRC